MSSFILKLYLIPLVVVALFVAVASAAYIAGKVTTLALDEQKASPQLAVPHPALASLRGDLLLK